MKYNSSYWLQDWEDDDIVIDSMTEIEKKSNDIYKLLILTESPFQTS